MTAAAVGLKVRTGCAVVVVLKGTRREPQIVLRHDIDLSDPWVSESRHPYHQELGDHGSAGEEARRRGCEAARRASRRAIGNLVEEMRAHDLEPRGMAIVASSLVEPARVAGAHARAHAEEGKLYREAVASALEECGFEVATFLEKQLRAAADKRLGAAAGSVDATLKAFSHAVGTPWRAPEKQAALAAWIVLRPESVRPLNVIFGSHLAELSPRPRAKSLRSRSPARAG